MAGNDTGNVKGDADPPPSAEKTTYRGNCHCGLMRYSVDLLGPLKQVHACNCSVCLRNGFLWVLPAKTADVRIEKGEDELKGYEWGKKTMVFKFCPKCGTSLYGLRHIAPDGMQLALNGRTIQDIDPTQMEISTYDGRSIDGPYHPPEPVPFKGEVPPGEKVYQANCHCGDVRYAVRMKPLEEEGMEVSTCDCSICTRNGHIFLYPPLSHVTFAGRENLTEYQFGGHIVTHLFCKTCGSSMGATWQGGQSWEGEEAKQKQEAVMACNVRMWEGVDLEKLKYKERFGGKEVGKPYELRD